MDIMDPPAQLSDALLGFALHHRFPKEDVASISVASTDLSPAIEALRRARADLETEIDAVSEETGDEVQTWVADARVLREDVIRSKVLASDIIREWESPTASDQAIRNAEARIEFVAREAQYSEQLCATLEEIREVKELLDAAETAKGERRILDSLRALERAWVAMDRVSISRSCRVMRLLDVRSFELKTDVHEAFELVWKALVHVDMERGKISIHAKKEGEPMNLEDAVIGLKAYKEVDERMEQLWHHLDATIISSLMSREVGTLPGVVAELDTLELRGQFPSTIEALLDHLQTFLLFLSYNLPDGLLPSLCDVMMKDLVPRLIRSWLDAESPSSLKEIDRFQEVIQAAAKFCTVLGENNFSHTEDLKAWVDDAPSMWLNKCRQTALEGVRSRLAGGISASKQVEKVEKVMVPQTDNPGPATGASAAVDTDWNAAWDDDGDRPATTTQEVEQVIRHQVDDDTAAEAWGWDDNEAPGPDDAEMAKDSNGNGGGEDEDDSAAAAWDVSWDNFGDDGTQKEKQTVDPTEQKKHDNAAARSDRKREENRPTAAAKEEGSREVEVREAYTISSMPEPVLELVFSVLEDGAALTQTGNQNNPVAPAAAGLFNLPAFALALFRAISPHYYCKDVGGNMYLYNDMNYLAERLAEFAANWKTRDDLTPRARNMLRLDNEIKSLQSFANRSYSNELAIQKTVIRDFLGGSSNLMSHEETEACIDSALARVRAMAVTWETILARSVWAQAVGALVDAVSTKFIADVMDMAAIGQEEAYRIAQLIGKVTELDDLFLLPAGPPTTTTTEVKSGGDGGRTPATAQFTPSWLRLKFLSEVLQSNLNEVRYLWFESDLSLYFTAAEVVDLINLSFESSARTRDVIRDVQQKPKPVRT